LHVSHSFVSTFLIKTFPVRTGPQCGVSGISQPLQSFSWHTCNPGHFGTQNSTHFEAYVTFSTFFLPGAGTQQGA
jgi:hypothetical protein